MAAGRLGKASLVSNTNTTIYTVPVGYVCSANVNIVNTSTTSASIRLAVSTVATPTTSDWIEYNFILPAKGVIERTGIVMSAGELVVVFANIAGVDVRVHGFEELI